MSNPPFDVQAQQLLDQLLVWKNTGNHWFKQEQYSKALAYYGSMLRYVGLSPKKELQIIDLALYKHITQNEMLKDKFNAIRIVALKNISAVHFKLKNWHNCIDKCNLILQYDAKDAKTLFRLKTATAKLQSQKQACIESKEKRTDRTVNKDVCRKFGIKPSHVYKLAKIPFKGYGLIANCEIKKGSVILMEAPVFTVDGITRLSVQKALQNIQKEDIMIIQTLSHSVSISSNDNIVNIILDIVTTNCISMNEHLKGLYATVCRINHECKPNALWHWNKHSRCQYVVALKHIKTGEEITVSYISHKSYQTKMQRREHIVRTYGFYCECSLCTDDRYETFDAINIEYQALKDGYFDFKDCNKADIEGVMKTKLKDNAKLIEINKKYFDGDFECAQLYAERMQICCDPIMRKFDEAYDCMVNAIKYYALNNGVLDTDIDKIQFGPYIKDTPLRKIIDRNYSKFPTKFQLKMKHFLDSIITGKFLN
eukprot:388844_1